MCSLIDRIAAIKAELAQLEIQKTSLVIGIEKADARGITPVDDGFSSSETRRYLALLLLERMNNLELERELLKTNLTS
jgi:hypothetical protein